MNDINEHYLTLAFSVPSKLRGGLTDMQVAEMLELKEHTLWYSQIKGWCDTPPECIGKETAEQFKYASKILFEFIENDYKITDNIQKDFQLNVIRLALLKDVLQQMRQKTLYVTSAFIEILILLLTNEIIKNNKETFKKILKDLKQSNENHVKAKCLHLECNVEVDRSKKKSGCCCIEHTKFYCKKCKCWHFYGTKIAESHYSFKVTDWIKDKNKREQIINGI